MDTPDDVDRTGPDLARRDSPLNRRIWLVLFRESEKGCTHKKPAPNGPLGGSGGDCMDGTSVFF